METKNSTEMTADKMQLDETPKLEQKGYEPLENEIIPVQQAETYCSPTDAAVEEAVRELNPDKNSMNSRG